MGRVFHVDGDQGWPTGQMAVGDLIEFSGQQWPGPGRFLVTEALRSDQCADPNVISDFTLVDTRWANGSYSYVPVQD